MKNYYNEFDPKAAAALKQLIADGLIPDGEVDDRSITEVTPGDLAGFTQCHFFAGIGGWIRALQIANFPTHRSVWTGSCPCQPYSSAGNQEGAGDDRHLWPTWLALIRECRPAEIYGEQVASAIAYGWLDDVCQGLEAENYACAAAVLPAVSVGAPHKRDRLWFVAHSQGTKSQGTCSARVGKSGPAGYGGPVADTCDNGCHENGKHISTTRSDGIVGDIGTLANTERIRQQGQGQLGQSGSAAARQNGEAGQSGDDSAGHWQGEWIGCPDGTQRLIKPGICLLADGVSERVGLLRAGGNAIVPEVAARFIMATM